MSKFCFIVAADYKYLPELVANLNSLDYVGNTQDVHLIGINMPGEFLLQLAHLNYKVIPHIVSEDDARAEGGISEITCRKRYWYAAEIGKDYDAVCVLDADLIWCRDPIQYFEIASKTGYILGPCKEQNKVYGTHEDDHHLVGGKWIWNIPDGFYNEQDMCNCPVFLDAKVWGDALRMSWDIFIKGGFKAPDMDAMNLCFLQYGSIDKTVKLVGLQWLATNEQLLKPYTRAVERHGKIYAENGIEIISYHGQFYHDKWRQCQLDNRHGCAERYLKTTECPDNMAQGAMNLLYSNFLKMLDWKIVIEKRDYRHS